MDLNVNKYTVQQLLEKFKLTQYTITEENLESSYKQRIEKVISAPFAQREKDQTIDFYREAKEVLRSIIPQKLREIREQFINIDTRFRSNYYSTSSSSFLIDLPILLKNVIEIGIETFESPINGSYYAIASSLGNNCFGIVSLTDNASLTIVVPNGNYTVNTLLSYINFILQEQTTSLKNLVVSTAGSDTDGTGQIIFATINPNSPILFNLDFQINSLGAFDGLPIQLKLGWMMGFRNPSYTGNSAYAAEAIPDISPPKYVFLSIDDFNVGGYASTQVIYTQSISTQNIIARVASTNSSIFNAQLVTLPRKYIHDGATISKLHISLIDEFGRIVQTNNIDYSFVIKLKIKY